jgi:hypothetical protein
MIYISIYACAVPSPPVYLSTSLVAMEMCYSPLCHVFPVVELWFVVVMGLCVPCLSEDCAVKPVEGASACSMRPRVHLAMVVAPSMSLLSRFSCLCRVIDLSSYLRP